jgi:hypothetical protein
LMTSLDAATAAALVAMNNCYPARLD